MNRGQRTEDRRQWVCRGFAASAQQPARSADRNLSSVLCPLSSAFCPLSSERGFSLVTAIFLLVVLAGLGAAMMTFFTAQQQSSALDVLGARAYQASRAGIEWGAYQVIQNSGVGFAPACRAGTTQNQVSLSGTLSGFGVSVACSATSHTEAATTLWVYQLTSTASGVGDAVPGAPDYVERQIQAAIAQ